MGRRDRERIARIEAGLEEPLSKTNMDVTREVLRHSNLARIATALASRSAVVQELSKGSTEDQVSRLSELAGANPRVSSKMGEAIKKKAPKEMDKGIDKLRKQGKEVTVDALCAEIKSTPGFLAMCERVGITLAWFEALAKERMEAHGL